MDVASHHIIIQEHPDQYHKNIERQVLWNFVGPYF